LILELITLVIYIVIHFVCSPCANINQFLATDYANCDIGCDMDISTELLELECINFVIVIHDNIALVFNLQQNSVQKEQTLLILHVDDNNLAKDDIVFTYLSFCRHPPPQPSPPLEVIPIPLPTTPRSSIISRPYSQSFHHYLTKPAPTSPISKFVG